MPGSPREPFTLRPYQQQAVDAVIAARRAGTRRMVLALPTGAGKTVIFAELIRRARFDVLVLAHRNELLEQARSKITAALRRSGQASRVVEIERGAARAAASASVLVASIRSLHEERIGRALAGRDIRLVVYDECHHAVADDNRRVLERLGCFAPDWPGTLVGVTATTRRADGRGLDEVFEQIVFARSLHEMIADGYLRPLRGIRVATQTALDEVAVTGAHSGKEPGEFDVEALAEQIDIESRNMLVARSIQELARDRRTIAFCVTVRHAENLCRQLNERGVPAGIVCGEMPSAARRHVLARFRRGELAVLTNVGVLTEGFDDPGVSAIAMVRPTRSAALYLQCIGRGMRLDSSATDCLVIDFVDLSRLELCTLASLVGGPGRPVEGAEDASTSASSREWEAEADADPEAPLTLTALTARLAVFDPLTMELAQETASLSPNAWLSLGQRGLRLYFQDHDGVLRHFELRSRGSRSRGYEVVWSERVLARFSNLADAVTAVDDELSRYGDVASARAGAAWRQQPVPERLGVELGRLRPPRLARNLGEAIEHLALG
ncbi:MAG: DEAD/DEAH box helicase [Myxococcales bacterium FL481]|nr:MAG: DEAD/DEAH box helicase [Myxococcales bacterium FL481]